VKDADIHASGGVAIREFPLADGFGFADYLLYVDRKAAGVIEAKKTGATLTGVETRSGRYSNGLPASLSAWRRPLPFLYCPIAVIGFLGGETQPGPGGKGERLTRDSHSGSQSCRKRQVFATCSLDLSSPAT
jgi:hypothetical protein